MQVPSLGREDSLEKEMASHSSILAWKIPWTEKPGRLQSIVWQRVGHNLVTKQYNTRKHPHKRQPLWQLLPAPGGASSTQDSLPQYPGDSMTQALRVLGTGSLGALLSSSKLSPTSPTLFLFSCSVVSNSLQPHGP